MFTAVNSYSVAEPCIFTPCEIANFHGTISRGPKTFQNANFQPIWPSQPKIMYQMLPKPTQDVQESHIFFFDENSIPPASKLRWFKRTRSCLRRCFCQYLLLVCCLFAMGNKSLSALSRRINATASTQKLKTHLQSPPRNARYVFASRAPAALANARRSPRPPCHKSAKALRRD